MKTIRRDQIFLALIPLFLFVGIWFSALTGWTSWGEPWISGWIGMGTGRGLLLGLGSLLAGWAIFGGPFRPWRTLLLFAAFVAFEALVPMIRPLLPPGPGRYYSVLLIDCAVTIEQSFGLGLCLAYGFLWLRVLGLEITHRSVSESREHQISHMRAPSVGDLLVWATLAAVFLSVTVSLDYFSWSWGGFELFRSTGAWWIVSFSFLFSGAAAWLCLGSPLRFSIWAFALMACVSWYFNGFIFGTKAHSVAFVGSFLFWAVTPLLLLCCAGWRITIRRSVSASDVEQCAPR